MSRIRRTRQAKIDIAAAFTYLNERNPEAARKLRDRLSEVTRHLAMRPMIGVERPQLMPGLRSFPVPPYIFFYLPDDDGILIVRFLHGARDIETLFLNEPGS
jgi:toxin ParE1/3/4